MILRGKSDTPIKAARSVSIILFGCILIIAALACIPNAKTAAGQSLIQSAGGFINHHSQPFFLAILILSGLEIVLLLVQYSIKYSSASDHIYDMAESLDSALDLHFQEHREISNELRQLEIDFISTSQKSLRTLDQNRFKIQKTLAETSSAYKDNLRNYYDCNKQIYFIVKNTQISQIHSIVELIESYDKL